MHILARYSDGWTERALRWEFESIDGAAHVTTSWNDARGIPQRAEWDCGFDEDLVDLDGLKELQEEYRSRVTDLEERELIVIEGGERIRRYVYGNLRGRALQSFYWIWDEIASEVQQGLRRRTKASPGRDLPFTL